MGCDPQSGTFTKLETPEAVAEFEKRVPDGAIFTTDEVINVKGIDFRVHEVGDTRLILKPVVKQKLGL